jgi:ABC-type sugar transport system permease subunit
VRTRGQQQTSIIERQKRRRVIPFLLLPLALFGTFMLYPALSTFYVSVLDWDGVGLPKLVGLDNFTELFADPNFGSASLHTIWFTVLGAVVLFPLALFFAAATRKSRSGKVYRFLILAPIALSVTTAALLWKFMLNPTTGFLPAFLKALGLDRLA